MKKIILLGLLLILTLTSCVATLQFPTTFTASTPSQSYSKEDCKKGGWQTLRTKEGATFKNQGDCVSYFASSQ
jgi:hypothetical protein